MVAHRLPDCRYANSRAMPKSTRSSTSSTPKPSTDPFSPLTHFLSGAPRSRSTSCCEVSWSLSWSFDLVGLLAAAASSGGRMRLRESPR